MKTLYKILIGLALIVAAFFLTTQHQTITKLKNSQTLVYDTQAPSFKTTIAQPDGKLSFIKTNINGKEAYLLIDTGANLTVIDTKAAAHLGLKTRESGGDITGIGGTTLMQEATNVKFIELGPNDYPVKVMVSDISGVLETINSAVSFKVVGILGSDFLTQNRMVIDYNQGIIFTR